MFRDLFNIRSGHCILAAQPQKDHGFGVCDWGSAIELGGFKNMTCTIRNYCHLEVWVVKIHHETVTATNSKTKESESVETYHTICFFFLVSSSSKWKANDITGHEENEKYVRKFLKEKYGIKYLIVRYDNGSGYRSERMATNVAFSATEDGVTLMACYCEVSCDLLFFITRDPNTNTMLVALPRERLE